LVAKTTVRVDETGGIMTAQQTATPQEVGAAIITALNDRDLDAVERLQHDGVRGNFIVVADFHGKPALREFFEHLFKAIPDFRLDIVRISGDGEYATV